MATFRDHPELKLIGAFDRDGGRTARFAKHHGVMGYRDMEEQNPRRWN